MAWLRRLVVRWLRLPADPQPPAGSKDSVRVFHAARNYYRYALVRWALRQVGVVVGVVFVLGFWQPLQELLQFKTDVKTVEEIHDAALPGFSWAERLGLIDVRRLPDDAGQMIVSFGPSIFWLELLGIVIIAAQAPVTYTLVRLDYEQRWYIVTDRSLRIREGITSVRESTMTFANIQNLAIEQGPIQRLLGIADLRVRTAGGGSGDGDDSSGESGKHKSMHIGYLRGVDNAPELRDAILSHLQRLKDSGLEDPAPRAVAPSDRGVAVTTAARELLEVARGLRAALQDRR